MHLSEGRIMVNTCKLFTCARVYPTCHSVLFSLHDRLLSEVSISNTPVLYLRK